ncbi:hypothetical protein Ae201684P_019223 [Aphanomyces euteiches]|nr:hypothetical protein Ae201684P_019223 [Aphanomyces euteiches]
MDTLPAAQAKRTAWENDRPNWNPTDEEFMALEKSIDLRIKRCQQLDQQCQKAFLRVKEYESSQERELLIDTDFEAFCQILGILGLVCSSKHEQNQTCLDFIGNISFDSLLGAAVVAFFHTILKHCEICLSGPLLLP